MASKYKIMAGQVSDIEKVKENPDLLEDWIFVDIGFAQTSKSCGVAVGRREAENVKFDKLVDMVAKRINEPSDNPLNLLLEAPLSKAFTTSGNPTARGFESKTKQTPCKFARLMDDTRRGWYYQAGASTMAGAVELISELSSRKRERHVRLFEGFAPLKGTGHKEVAKRLRDVVEGKTSCPIVPPNEIMAGRPSGYRRLIAGIAGWDANGPLKDCKIPPVVWVPSKCLSEDPESPVGQCPCTILRNQVQ